MLINILLIYLIVGVVVGFIFYKWLDSLGSRYKQEDSNMEFFSIAELIEKNVKLFSENGDEKKWRAFFYGLSFVSSVVAFPYCIYIMLEHELA